MTQHVFCQFMHPLNKGGIRLNKFFPIILAVALAGTSLHSQAQTDTFAVRFHNDSLTTVIKTLIKITNVYFTCDRSLIVNLATIT